ncbi:MAG: D-serine ammonia-lyase [Clostridiales bacterium GWB2_37_7]|nr:MAG: D-serine ammonia-lyase [Clostridiales bacterium GWB2_37_7]
MEQKKIVDKTIDQWVKENPILADMTAYKPVFWLNDNLKDKEDETYKNLQISWTDVLEAEERWIRFAPLIVRLFLQTELQKGIIESELQELPNTKEAINRLYHVEIQGRLFLKCDNALPVAGSIKARGGIYEVLKHAEKLVMSQGLLKKDNDYSVLANKEFKEFFSKYSLAVGSTGNLGLSIGIMGAALGFKVTVHMSADAKQWKKDLLRSKGVIVVEYESDYSKAVEEGRKLALQDPMCHFVDDEHSKDLFLGYSAAAIRLKRQLEERNIKIDKQSPLFVYLPCGVGGAPGGICFGLKQLFRDAVHCFFVEPTHSPCMLLGLATKMNDKVSVQDFGIDNITEGDGLAVGRASGFVGKVMENLLSGVYTVEDQELYRLLALLKDCEGIEIEPSAAASLMGPAALINEKAGIDYIEGNSLELHMNNATHIAWATGGSFVPTDMKQDFYEKGKSLL